MALNFYLDIVDKFFKARYNIDMAVRSVFVRLSATITSMISPFFVINHRIKGMDLAAILSRRVK